MSEEVDDLFDFNPELDSMFKNADVTSKGNRSEVPDGNYNVVISKVALEKTKANTPKLNLHLKITNGNHKGRLIFQNYNLNHKVGIEILAKDLHTLGIKLDSLKELKDRVGELLDLNVAVHKKTKESTKEGKTYTNVNVYFNELLPAESMEDSDGEGDGETKSPDDF